MNNKFEKDELDKACGIVLSTIKNCKNMQSKFAEGSSQSTLLINRIKALSVSKALLSDGQEINQYSTDDIMDSVAPISSIISKSENAQKKFEEGTAHYTRLDNLIKAMYISMTLITDELNKRARFIQ